MPPGSNMTSIWSPTAPKWFPNGAPMASKIDPEPDLHENLKTSVLGDIYYTWTMPAMSKISYFRSPEPQENDQKTVVQKTLENNVTTPYLSDFEAKLSQNGTSILRAAGVQHPSLFRPFSTLMPRGVIFDPRAPRDLKMTPKWSQQVTENHQNSTQMLKEWTPQTKNTKSKKHRHSVLFFMVSANEIHRKSTGNQGTREPGNQETKEPGTQGTREPRNSGTKEPGDQGTKGLGNQGTRTRKTGNH